MRNIFLLSGLVFFFSSCQSDTSSNEKMVMLQESPVVSSVKYSPPVFKLDDELSDKFESEETTEDVADEKPLTYKPVNIQKLIRRAEVRMQVKDYENSTAVIQKKIAAYKAYITDGTEERAGEDLENSLEIRVNNTNFDNLLKELLGESIYLERKNITVSDVSEEYIDKAARLKTKLKIEQRYLGLLAKAKNVKDILQIEEQLSSIREEIEASEARLRYLDHQVAYSTIHINYFEKVPAPTSPDNSFVSKIANALKIGWAGLGNTLLALINIWPLLVIFIPVLVWGIRKYKSRQVFEVSN